MCTPPPEDTFRVDFYRDDSGEKPAATVLRRLIQSNRILADRIQVVLRRLTERKYHGVPHTKDIGGGLFEARVHDGDDARVLYFHGERRQLVVVHVFVKKTNKLPRDQRDIALARMKRWHEQHQERQES